MPINQYYYSGQMGIIPDRHLLYSKDAYMYDFTAEAIRKMLEKAENDNACVIPGDILRFTIDIKFLKHNSLLERKAKK